MIDIKHILKQGNTPIFWVGDAMQVRNKKTMQPRHQSPERKKQTHLNQT